MNDVQSLRALTAFLFQALLFCLVVAWVGA